MSLSTTISRKNYNANGISTSFSTNFKFFEENDLYVTVTSGSNTSLKTLNVDYTVTGVGDNNGGSVTFVVAPVSGSVVTLYRSTDLQQNSNYVNSGRLSSQNIERDFDRVVALIQELKEGTSGTNTGSLYLSYPNNEPSSTTNVLPQNADRVNKFFTFDNNGAPSVLSISGSGLGNVSSVNSSNTIGYIPTWGSSSYSLNEGYATTGSGALTTHNYVNNAISNIDLSDYRYAKTQTLSSGSSITWNMALGHNAHFSSSISSSVTSSNITPGSYNLFIYKTSTGSHLTFDNSFILPDSVLSAYKSMGAGSASIFSFMSINNNKLYGSGITGLY